MSATEDVESAASWRSYKNNRYASLGAQRILRLLREHFRTNRHVRRLEEDFEIYAWRLFAELNDAGAFALLHCGVAEENERTRREQDNRRRRAKGLPPEPTPEEREARLVALEEQILTSHLAAMRAQEAREAEARKERRKMQLAQPWNRRARDGKLAIDGPAPAPDEIKQAS